MTRAPGSRLRSSTACSSHSFRPRRSTAPGSVWRSASDWCGGWAVACGCRTSKGAARGGGRPAVRRLSLLVVEDEEAVRRAMALLAKRLGHDVTTVGRFADAPERLGQPGARYDALLVDVHLDEAHTGFDLFDFLRTAGQGLEQRIVFTTGDSISTQTRDALERADRPVLRKPFSLDDLREMLERVTSG